MNQQIIKGKWKEFVGKVQKTWGRMTNDEHAHRFSSEYTSPNTDTPFREGFEEVKSSLRQLKSTNDSFVNKQQQGVFYATNTTGPKNSNQSNELGSNSHS